MHTVRISSGSTLSRNLALQQGLMTLFARSAAMGVLPHQPLIALDDGAVRGLVDAWQQADLLQSAAVDLAPLLRQSAADLDPATAAQMSAVVARLAEALDESPSPATEWAPMRELFGDEPLCALLGVADASLRRYAAGTRTTPQRTAERLHWLAMVAADLAGGYNDYGIRRWFERPRSQLDGASPRQRLGADWGVDGEPAASVRALAAALVGAQPLAT